MPERARHAVLITGPYGTGKSSIAMEIADVLERRHLPYALLDLDFLAWFDTGVETTSEKLWLANLAAVTENYRGVGVRFFVLAGTVSDRSEVNEIEAVMGTPVRVIRLDVPFEEIERRLRADVTTGRRDDLREAAEQIASAEGVGIQEITVANEGPIREVAMRILEWLRWLDPSGPEP